MSTTENNSNFTNTGLYSGNVIIEYNTDQKVVKPVIKVNEKASVDEITLAVNNAIWAINQASFELFRRDYEIPEPLKKYIEKTIKEMEEQEKMEDEYEQEKDDQVLTRDDAEKNNGQSLKGHL